MLQIFVIFGQNLDFVVYQMTVVIAPDFVTQIFLFLANMIDCCNLILEILDELGLKFFEIPLDFRLESFKFILELIFVFNNEFSVKNKPHFSN